MNSELSTSLVWQMNQEQLPEAERNKLEPRHYLDRVKWQSVELRPMIYPLNRNYMICELLANWVWRNLKLDLSEKIEVGTVGSFSFVRVKGRTFSEHRYNITELDRNDAKV